MITRKSVRVRYWPSQKTYPPKTNSRRFLITAPIGLKYNADTPKKYVVSVGVKRGKGLLLAHTHPPKRDGYFNWEQHQNIVAQYCNNSRPIYWMGNAKMYVGKDAQTEGRIAQLDYITGPSSMDKNYIEKFEEKRFKVKIYQLEGVIHTWIDINSPLGENLNAQSF